MCVRLPALKKATPEQVLAEVPRGHLERVGYQIVDVTHDERVLFRIPPYAVTLPAGPDHSAVAPIPCFKIASG
jgi:hypothetical protein